jgi:hypothetical protein
MRRILCFALVYFSIWGFIFGSSPSRPSRTVLQEVSPYLIPENHPAKKKLDKIFSKSRALATMNSMKRAGFDASPPRKYTHLVIARHPKLKGLVIKAYLDSQRYPGNKPEHVYWLLRVKGSLLLRESIQAHQWEHLFKVPKKWIYELPAKPRPPATMLRKYFILVEEDMDLCSHEENLERWKNETVATKSFLKKFFILLNEIGLADCAKPDNSAFSVDGRVAFIDTQTFHEIVAYEKMVPFLPESMKDYWKQLVKKKE